MLTAALLSSAVLAIAMADSGQTKLCLQDAIAFGNAQTFESCDCLSSLQDCEAALQETAVVVSRDDNMKSMIFTTSSSRAVWNDLVGVATTDAEQGQALYFKGTFENIEEGRFTSLLPMKVEDDQSLHNAITLANQISKTLLMELVWITDSPTPSPTPSPTATPTQTPTGSPTASPTDSPTAPVCDLVVRQTGAPPYLFTKDQWTYGTPGSSNFSDLADLEKYRNPAGELVFKLRWPGSRYQDVIWAQTSNPKIKLSGYRQSPTGYREIVKGSSGPYSWGGLHYNGHAALMDGQSKNDDPSYFYAVGVTHNGYYSYGGIPGPTGKVNQVELYVGAGCE